MFLFCIHPPFPIRLNSHAVVLICRVSPHPARLSQASPSDPETSQLPLWFHHSILRLARLLKAEVPQPCLHAAQFRDWIQPAEVEREDAFFLPRRKN